MRVAWPLVPRPPLASDDIQLPWSSVGMGAVGSRRGAPVVAAPPQWRCPSPASAVRARALPASRNGRLALRRNSLVGIGRLLFEYLKGGLVSIPTSASQQGTPDRGPSERPWTDVSIVLLLLHSPQLLILSFSYPFLSGSPLLVFAPLDRRQRRAGALGQRRSEAPRSALGRGVDLELLPLVGGQARRPAQA
ncbi:unnamed protein product [Prorocentrum cordatum]|uniref:Uncharacterized protein n=1 Tax=Prorocentrum cordatum TaxID=2364126 RepID=A0ABN9SVQ4_9DINO|nr:unnamed protein product [Polarella glacialis]